MADGELKLPDSGDSAGGRRRTARHAITALAVLVPVLAADLVAFRSWRTSGERLAARRAEVERLRGENARLAPVHAALASSTFTVVNRGADPVDVTWVAAAWPDESTLRLFDSTRCSEWRVEPLPSGGGGRSYSLNSPEEGCNWAGGVLFYTLAFQKQDRLVRVVGPWQGFDGDKFNIR